MHTCIPTHRLIHTLISHAHIHLHTHSCTHTCSYALMYTHSYTRTPPHTHTNPSVPAEPHGPWVALGLTCLTQIRGSTGCCSPLDGTEPISTKSKCKSNCRDIYIIADGASGAWPVNDLSHVTADSPDLQLHSRPACNWACSCVLRLGVASEKPLPGCPGQGPAGDARCPGDPH